MRIAGAAALLALFTVACQSTTGEIASSVRATPSPSQAAMSTKLYCDTHVGAHAFAIYRFSRPSPFVEMLDVSNPLRPSIVCRLDPANGARLLSDTKLAFWIGNELGTADLSSGAITLTARLPIVASTGAFSADGTKFAYRSYDAAGAMSTHLFAGGSDRVLYVEEPVGGHGGPGMSFGPFDQLEFSPDGSRLLDAGLFRPQTAPGNFLVFKSSDGSFLFRSTVGSSGTWSPVGSSLYFALGQAEQMSELESMTADGQRKVVATGLNGFYWARMSPDGRSIVYNASDTSVPDCGGGVPHLWRLDLASGHSTQLSKAISSGPFFVQPNVVWSDEQQLSPCGPGGPSSPDGVILAHDLSTGAYAKVDTTLLPATAGPLSTFNLLDTWSAPA